MLELLKQSLDSIPHDGSIYLAQQLSQHSGFFVSNGHLLYLVYNLEGTTHTTLTTDYLLINTNVDIHSFQNNQLFPSGRYNILELLPTESGYEENNLESFVNLCISHTEYMKGAAFVKFFFSLCELFQEPRDQQYKNLVGFFGELAFIKMLCQKHKLDLSSNWHKGGSRDKYEITLVDKNIEIKTTSAFDDGVTIKHAQLFNPDLNYLAVVQVEETSSGQTINQLISSMLTDPEHYKNLNFMLNLEREKKRISPVDADRKKFCVRSIEIYLASEINPFDEIPDCVSHLTYKLDLVDKKCVPEYKWKTEFCNL